MNVDTHCRNLGALLANLQSLEFLIRGFLCEMPGALPKGLADGANLYDTAVGQWLPVNPMTNYDTLNQLVSTFNQIAEQSGRQTIDSSLIELRDALAHGRVAASVPDEFPRLMKFSRPVDGKVRVMFNELMHTSWFEIQIHRVFKAHRIVYESAIEMRKSRTD